MKIDPKDIKVVVTEDKPKSGMWHCGPNRCWVEIMHNPTGVRVRAFNDTQYKARQLAIDSLEYLLVGLDEPPQFKENLDEST